MFEPELFGLSSLQYQQVALSLITPALGFLFLYALGLPLKKLPFIDAIKGYSPPAWVLPLFALGSLSIVSLCLSITFFLGVFRAYPSDREFMGEFIKERPLSIPADVNQLQGAKLDLEDYDGLSNFGLFVNGYRILGSASDCLLSYQCKPNNVIATEDFKLVQQLEIKDTSIHHIHSIYTIPFSTNIMDHLIQGDNFVDVISGNSGLGDCRIAATISLSFSQATLNYKVIISPEQGSENLHEYQTGKVNEKVNEFFAGGQPITGDEEPPKYIGPYGTLWAEGTDRLCERVRVKFTLTQQPLTRQMRKRLLFARHRALLCEVLNYGRSYCERPAKK